ncbi:extracellular catalytic domain type 1 short-chain-length polyhydroxyalkanoate depolymerase [Nocardia suismassiliense]|uniref:extracellular catalytic domain type 1 short-chain-length polyhydroxyalkanoate depolymerase n=1 Tax=Nocardia suismassiliense TaxID=2077092 RepID=UPI000D1E4950|nr:PHB depolymerase family esterase [Nocardia suismassiliense]
MRVTELRLSAVLLLIAAYLLAGMPGAQAQIDRRCFTNDAGTRCYYLHVPPGATAGKPLMVYLHGCDDPLAHPRPSGFSLTRVADEMGFVLAYPLQDQAANRQQCWNWDKAENQQRGQGEPSIIAGITTALIEQFQLDRARVYLGGYSAGGATVTNLGATYPDLYAAIAPMAGAPYRTRLDGQAIIDAMGPRARPMPAFFLQTLFDQISNIVIGRTNLAQWLAADNLADPGSAPALPTSTQVLVIGPGLPIPLTVEHYASPRGCELAQFTTPLLAEHALGAGLLQQDHGIEIQRNLMRFLLAHRMPPPAQTC